MSDRSISRGHTLEPAGADGPDRLNGQGYAAFISYSHAVDGRLAPALQGALHRFAKPWYRLRALRVFRDDASLSANPHLWSSIQEALDSARFFILLASPEAARSVWVQREVEYWCRHKPAANLLIALTDGVIAWDATAGDFDWDRTTALPRSLEGRFDSEPRWIDLGWARTQEHLSLNDPRFRAGVADLAAPLHGRAKDELFGEDVRQHRRTVRLARSAIASLTVLTLLAGGAAVLYADQRNVARAETVRAREQTSLATSRLFAAEADARVTSQPILSTLLSVAAYQTADTLEARGGLLRQMERRRDVQGFLAGHRDGVRGVTFSPDGRTLASGGLDRRVIVWDTRRRTQLATVESQSNRIFALAFSPDGRTLAWGGENNTVILWDVRRRARLATLKGHRHHVYSLAFGPDGRTLASGSKDSTIILWDVRRHARLATLVGHADWVTSLAFHPDGRTLASGDRGTIVLLWDVASGTRRGPPFPLQPKAPANASPIPTYLAYSPDGRTLAVGAGARIGIWDLGRRPHLRVLPGRTPWVRGLAFSPDGKTLVSGSTNGTVVLWDVARGVKAQTFAGHADQVTSVAISPDGRTVASASLDRTVVLWDVARRGRPGVAVAASGDVMGMAFGVDGRTLAWADETAVFLWDVARQVQVGLLREGDAVGAFAFSPDGRTIASTGGTGVVLWDVAARVRLATLEGRLGDVWTMAFSPDSRMLATGYDTTVVLWDVAARTPLATLEGHAEPVGTVAFSPDGGMLAVGAHDQIVLWDVARRTRLATLEDNPDYVASVAFSPDGQTLAAGAFPDTIELWDVERRTRLASLDGAAVSLAFSPDGRTLAAASYQAVTVWDVERRTRLASLDDVSSFVAFSPDGRILAAAGRDQPVIMRDFDVGSWRRHLCAIVGRDLTTDEWQDFIPDQPYRRTCS